MKERGRGRGKGEKNSEGVWDELSEGEGAGG